MMNFLRLYLYLETTLCFCFGVENNRHARHITQYPNIVTMKAEDDIK